MASYVNTDASYRHDWAKGYAMELDSFMWIEGDEKCGPVVMIGKELDEEMTIGADKTVPGN